MYGFSVCGYTCFRRRLWYNFATSSPPLHLVFVPGAHQTCAGHFFMGQKKHGYACYASETVLELMLGLVLPTINKKLADDFVYLGLVWKWRKCHFEKYETIGCCDQAGNAGLQQGQAASVGVSSGL